jgi:hypothetical protein
MTEQIQKLENINNYLDDILNKQEKEKNLKELKYWKKRCELSEMYIEQSPCDFDTTMSQLSAYSAWNHFKNLIIPSKSEPKEETILESIKRIIEDVSGIQDLFIVSRVQKYVAYRSLFDYLIQHYTGFTYIGIADYSGRHRATVKNSLDNYKGYSKDALYEENFDAIINIYLETTNHE